MYAQWTQETPYKQYDNVDKVHLKARPRVDKLSFEVDYRYIQAVLLFQKEYQNQVEF